MKRLIYLFTGLLLLAGVCGSAAIIEVPEAVAWMSPAITGGGVPVAAAGDDCSGALVVSIHFEDNTDPTNIVDSGGCNDGTATTADLIASASIQSGGVGTHDGSTYFMDVGTQETSSVRLALASAGMAAGVSVTGTYCMDYYKSDDGAGQVFQLGSTGVINGRITDNGTDYSLVLSYDDVIMNGDAATQADSNWARICFSWDLSPAGGSQCLATQIEGNAWAEECNKTMSDVGLNATMDMASSSWHYARGNIDNLKLYSTYKAEDNE